MPDLPDYPPDAFPTGRRGFLTKNLALLLGAVAYGVPAATGLLAFLNPWRDKSATSQMIRVASLASLPVGGPIERFPVVADRSDAWNRYPAEPIGAVFLRRLGDKEVLAMQVACPHAGCFVGCDAKAGTFACPCHGAQFDCDGKRTQTPSTSPRDLDRLEVEIRNDNEVWVKFERFQVGTPNKIVKT